MSIVIGNCAKSKAFSIAPTTIPSIMQVQGSIGYIALALRSFYLAKGVHSIVFGSMSINALGLAKVLASQAFDIWYGIPQYFFPAIPFEANSILLFQAV